MQHPDGHVLLTRLSVLIPTMLHRAVSPRHSAACSKQQAHPCSAQPARDAAMRQALTQPGPHQYARHLLSPCCFSIWPRMTWMMRSKMEVRSAWKARQCKHDLKMTSAARGLPLWKPMGLLMAARQQALHVGLELLLELLL